MFYGPIRLNKKIFWFCVPTYSSYMYSQASWYSNRTFPIVCSQTTMFGSPFSCFWNVLFNIPAKFNKLCLMLKYSRPSVMEHVQRNVPQCCDTNPSRMGKKIFFSFFSIWINIHIIWILEGTERGLEMIILRRGEEGVDLSPAKKFLLFSYNFY